MTPTRQSYLMAMVRPEERIVRRRRHHLRWRRGSRRSMPAARCRRRLAAAAAAAMKIAYDWILWVQFRRVRPPEEERSGG
jgi:hypothetical protein